MGKTRFDEDRKLIALAEQRATVETAASSLGKSDKSLLQKTRVLGIHIKDGRLVKQHSATELGLKAKAK